MKDPGMLLFAILAIAGVIGSAMACNDRWSGRRLREKSESMKWRINRDLMKHYVKHGYTGSNPAAKLALQMGFMRREYADDEHDALN